MEHYIVLRQYRVIAQSDKFMIDFGPVYVQNYGS